MYTGHLSISCIVSFFHNSPKRYQWSRDYSENSTVGFFDEQSTGAGADCVVDMLVLNPKTTFLLEIKSALSLVSELPSYLSFP